jgi:hypothetical protein
VSPDASLVAAIDTTGDVSNVWDATTGVPIAEIGCQLGPARSRAL